MVKNQYDPNIEKVMNTRSIPIAGNFLGSNPDNYDCADFTCDTIIDCTFERENKKQMAEFKVGPKIVMVLIHFSKPENWDKPLVNKCLIVLGNLTYEAMNNYNISMEGIVPAMIDALKTCEMDKRTVALILGTTGNLSYEYDPPVLSKVTNDGAIGIYADCLREFDKINDVPMFMLAVDGLANIAHNTQICKIIRGFDLIGYLLRRLKAHQDDPKICYKVTRCLYRLCGDDGIKQQIIDRNGHEVIIETTDNLFEDPGTCLNC